MFGNFSQQMKKSTKPASALLEMNAKTLELVSKQQTVFFSGLMTDSKKLLSTILTQTEMKGVIAAQTVYAESVKERFTTVSKNTYGGLSDIGKDAASVMKDSVESVGAEAKEVMSKVMTPSAKAKVSPAAAAKTVKPAAKEASKPVAKKAAPKKAATVAKKPVAKKAPIKKVVAEKAVAASAPIASKKVTPQATPPVVEKPVVAPKSAKADAAPAAVSTPAAKAKVTKAKKTAPKKAVAELSPADVKAENPKSK